MVIRKFISLIEMVSRFAIGGAFVVLITAVMVQVIGRSIVNDSPVWTEELTRFALLFLAAFGAGLGFRSGDLVNVDVICEALPRPLPWLLRFVSALITAGLSLTLIGPAWTFTSIGVLQTSPALGWRMDFILVSMFILLLSLAVFASARIVEMLTGISDGLPGERQSD